MSFPLRNHELIQRAYNAAKTIEKDGSKTPQRGEERRCGLRDRPFFNLTSFPNWHDQDAYVDPESIDKPTPVALSLWARRTDEII